MTIKFYHSKARTRAVGNREGDYYTPDFYTCGRGGGGINMPGGGGGGGARGGGGK